MINTEMSNMNKIRPTGADDGGGGRKTEVKHKVVP
jgi:hypothetical protein